MRTLIPRIILAIFVAISAVAPAISGAVEIRLIPSVEVNEGEVFLAEVANLSKVSRRIRGELEDVFLASAPPSGMSFRISRETVGKSIRNAGIEGVTLAGARVVRVRNSTRILDQQEMVSAVQSFLKSRLINRNGDVEIKTIFVPRQRILLPGGGNVQLMVQAPPNTRFIGRTPLILRVIRGASEIRRIWVTAEIAIYMDVPVARRPIRAMETLKAADFEFRRQDMASMPSDTITSVPEFHGAIAIRAISPGSMVRKSDVKFPYLVKRGHLVHISARSGGLSITAIGKSLDAGRKGDLIRVINIDSKKPVHARIVGASSVEVLF